MVMKEREIIYNQNVSKIYHLLLKMVGSAEDARDLTHDVFIRFFQNQSQFKYQSSVSTYLYRIAVNTGINFINKKKTLLKKVIRHPDAMTDVVNDEPDAQELIIRREFESELKEALGDLPENQAKAFCLNKYEKLSHKDIAEILNLSVGAVESLVHRAKQTLAEKFFKNRRRK